MYGLGGSFKGAHRINLLLFPLALLWRVSGARLSACAGAAPAERGDKGIRNDQRSLHPTEPAGARPPRRRSPARTGSRSPILVGIYSEAPVCKQTCTHVQVCAQRLFFWTVHSPFSFRLAEKKMGGWIAPPSSWHHLPSHRDGPWRHPLWNRFVKIKSTPAS